VCNVYSIMQVISVKSRMLFKTFTFDEFQKRVVLLGNCELFRAESHGYALYASCRNPMVNLFGRNFEATTTKFCTHVNEHGVQRCIDFHKHRLMASYILKTIKLNFRLNTVFTSLTKMHMVTSVTQTYIQSSPISDKNVS